MAFREDRRQFSSSNGGGSWGDQWLSPELESLLGALALSGGDGSSRGENRIQRRTQLWTQSALLEETANQWVQDSNEDGLTKVRPSIVMITNRYCMSTVRLLLSSSSSSIIHHPSSSFIHSSFIIIHSSTIILFTPHNPFQPSYGGTEHSIFSLPPFLHPRP